MEAKLQELTNYLKINAETYEENPYMNKFCKYMQLGLSRIFIPKQVEISLKSMTKLKA